MNNLDNVIRKARSSQFTDGLMELMLGVFMLISAMALELVGEPLLSGVVAIAGIFAAAKFFERLQLQVSVPRTGYVQYQDQSDKGRLWNFVTLVLVAVVILSLFFWLLANNPNTALAWLGLIVGAVIGAALLALSVRLRLWRLALHGLVSLLLGLLLSPAVLGSDPASGTAGLGLMSIYFFGMGISLSLGGWITLNRFIKIHPVRRETKDG